MSTLLGLHPLDAAIVVGSLLAVLFIGWWVSRDVKGEEDFFAGGKSMGPWLQFFINFGQATDSNGAPTIATEVYRQGVGGMWIGFQTLFITPFVWFTSIFFRRTRLLTGPELFIERFRMRGLPTLFAAFILLQVPVTLGLGNIISYKVAAAMMVKEEAAYTAEDRATIDRYHEYEALHKDFTAGTLIAPEKKARYEELDSLRKKGQLPSDITCIAELPFYIVYTAVVAFYIMLGGLKAAAITDAVQGLLIIAFSVIMIPLGLNAIGGFTGLHAKVPEHFFNLFGADLGDYTWYSILFIILGGLMTYGNPGMQLVQAAGKDVKSIRIGMLSGLFLKRFVMIAWMLCGLIAVALLPGGMSDPDATWGALAKTLLGPGLMGIMISGMLLGHMPAVGVNAVNFSATFTRNVYEPLFVGRDGKHYLFVAKASIAGVLFLGVGASMFFKDVIPLLSSLIAFGAFFGAVGFLIYFWRRLTGRAVMIGAVIWIVMMTVVAWGMPRVESFRRIESLQIQTAERTTQVTAVATDEDVKAGKAAKVGETITKTRVIAPKSVFFDSVARIDPKDPSKGTEGVGRFQVENWISYQSGRKRQMVGRL
jgi:SSS family solute:Na+ symporter